MWRYLGAIACAVAIATPALAQTPQPFPKPGGTPPQQRPATPAPQPATSAPPQSPPPAAAAQRAAPSATAAGAPDAATLVFPVYPTAQYLASYDAGRGQRYYLFGSTAAYADLVAYYRAQLKDKGDEVFSQPPTHMFSVGRFREETMAFPPGVTVKDWTWGGSKGYPNPKPGSQPERFPTIIMIVPPPPAPGPQR